MKLSKCSAIHGLPTRTFVMHRDEFRPDDSPYAAVFDT